MISGLIAAIATMGALYFGRNFVRRIYRGGIPSINKLFSANDSNVKQRQDLSGFQSRMTPEEAAKILGLGKKFARSDVSLAHRKIIINNHPDRGGSPYIASKVNEAKDVLLKC